MSSLRQTANNQQCFIRIPGVCNWDRSTTVLCHFNGGGTALKKDDTEAAFGCSNCHSAVDGKPVVKRGFMPEEIKLMFMEGAERTRDYWRKHGFIASYK